MCKMPRPICMNSLWNWIITTAAEADKSMRTRRQNMALRRKTSAGTTERIQQQEGGQIDEEQNRSTKCLGLWTKSVCWGRPPAAVKVKSKDLTLLLCIYNIFKWNVALDWMWGWVILCLGIVPWRRWRFGCRGEGNGGEGQGEGNMVHSKQTFIMSTGDGCFFSAHEWGCAF